MVILDAADCWAAALEKEGIISKFIPIDFHDESTVFDTCVQHIKAVEKVRKQQNSARQTCHITSQTFILKLELFLQTANLCTANTLPKSHDIVKD